MDTITVVFMNGDVVSFPGTEFGTTPDRFLGEQHPGRVTKFSYKNGQGEDSFIYLRPNAVAGVFLTQAEPRSLIGPITVHVAGQQAGAQ